MVIKIDDMEFHWRWKWNAGSRPSQWGSARWLTVPEYYSTFCHWKDNMLSHGCPAEEGNYIDAFLENLRQELSIKVIHSRSQMSSLAVAFCYAALEEMMMNIDAKFEESRLNRANVSNEFEASKVFDKIPSRYAQKEFSSVILPRVFDKSPDRISEAFVSLEAGVKLDNGVDCYEELEDEDDASGLIATNEDFNSMLATTAIHWDKEDGGQGDSARTTGETKNSVDEEMENGACEVFAEMTISVEACLQLFPLNYITQGERNWLSDGDFQPPALRIGSVEVAYHLCEEMAKSIPAEVGNQLPDEVGQLHSLKFESLISDGVIHPFDPGGRCVFYKARDPLESNKEEHKLDKFRGISFDSDSAVNMIRYYQCKPMLLSVEETKVLPIGSSVFMSPNNQGEVWVFLLKEFMVNINDSSSQSSCVQQGTVYVVRKIFEPISSNSNKRMTHHLISQVEDQENESTRRRYFGNNTCDIQHHMAEQLAIAGINRIPHIELAQEFSIKGANLFYILKKLEFNGLIVQQLTLVRIKDASELKNKPFLMTDVFCLHWNAEFSDCQWTLAKFEQKKSACLNLLKELIDNGYTVCGNIIEGNDVFVGGNDVYRYELRSAHESERSICLCRCFLTIRLICITTFCLIIHVNIATELLERFVNWCQVVKVLDPLEVGCRLGLVASKGQYEYDMILIFVSKAVNKVAHKIEQFEEFNGKMIHPLTHPLQPPTFSVGHMVQPSSSMENRIQFALILINCAEDIQHEDEAIDMKSAVKFHQLSAWSWDFENVLSFVERYIVRKLKAHDEIAGDLKTFLVNRINISNDMIPHKEMNMTFNLCLWKYQWGCRDVYIRVAEDTWETLVWDPGLAWDLYIITLRTRWLFSRRICHEYGLKLKNKIVLTKAQPALLEDRFKLHNSLNLKQMKESIEELKMRDHRGIYFSKRTNECGTICASSIIIQLGEKTDNRLLILQMHNLMQVELNMDATVVSKLIRCVWKCDEDGEITWVLQDGVTFENFVWDPGLYMVRLFLILEDKDVLKGKDLSGSKGFEGISHFVLLSYFPFYVIVTSIAT